MRDLNRWGWWLWLWLITLALVVAMAIRAAATGPGELARSLPTAVPTAPSTPTPSATPAPTALPTRVPTASRPLATAEPAPARIRILLGACYGFEPGQIIPGRLIRGRTEIELEAWFGANGEAVVHEAPAGEWALWLDLPGEPIAQSCEVLAGAVTVMPYWECGWGVEVGPS